MVVNPAQDGSVAGERAGIVGRLRSEAAEVAEAFARDLHRTNPLYRDITDPALLGRSRDAAQGSIVAFAGWLERGTRALDRDEFVYLREQAADSAAQLFPLDALEEPVRMGLGLLWQWIIVACRDAHADPSVALDLLEELTFFQGEVQRVLTDAYVQARFQPDAEEREAQHEVLELLLGGRPVGREIHARLATDYGLTGAGGCLVLVATTDAPRTSGATGQATAVARQGPASRRWLVADRGDEIVGVIPIRTTADEVVDEVSLWLHHLRRVHGIDLRAGLSTPCDLSEVPDRYVEAQEGLRLSDDQPGRLGALSRVRLFDYLTNRVDPTARRLVPSELQRLRLEDERTTGVLIETLRALADADLNVRRAAKALFVHPNTVHYRVRRIAELTGRDPRSFRDLVDLLAGLRCGVIAGAPENPGT